MCSRLERVGELLHITSQLYITPVVDLPKDFSASYLVRMLMPPLQVGNAVPPPMAKAIGLEMKKCVEEKSKIAN